MQVDFFKTVIHSVTVTSYENALEVEQALQITYSVLFHKVINVLFFIIILSRLKGIYFRKQADENKN